MIARILHRHTRWTQLADAYIDGELGPSQLARFEAHLAGCKRCQSAVESARSTKVLLASAPAVQAPRSFALTPEMAARDEPAPTRRPVALRLAQVATAVAVVAFATVLAIDLTGGGRSNGPQPLAASEQTTSAKAPTGAAVSDTTASPAASMTPAPSASPSAPPTSPPIAPPPTEGAGAQGLSPSASPTPASSPTAAPATAEPSPTTSVPVAPRTGPGFGAQDTSGGAATANAHTAPRQSSVTAGWYRPAEIALGAAALIAAVCALALAIRRRRV